MNDSLPKFDKPFTLMITACKGSGKSTLLNTLITEQRLGIYQNYSKVWLFSPTFKDDPVFTFELPDEQVFNDVSDMFLNMIIDDKMSDEESTENHLIIFDDCISDKNIKRSSILKQLILNSRHYGEYCEETEEQYGFSLIFSGQHQNSLPPYIRQNMNYTINFRTNNRKMIECMYNEYYAAYDFNKFMRLYNHCTSEQYNFIMTDGMRVWKNFDLMKVNNMDMTKDKFKNSESKVETIKEEDDNEVEEDL